MAEILTGAPVAEAMIQSLIPRVEKLKSAGITPRLAIIRLGEVGSRTALLRLSFWPLWRRSTAAGIFRAV